MHANKWRYLPDRVRLALGLILVSLCWWLYVLPRDCGRAVRRVALCSWHDAALLWRGILAGERIDCAEDPLDLYDE